MSTSPASVSRAISNLIAPALVMAFAFAYLGISPSSSVLLAMFWVMSGVIGSWVLQLTLGVVGTRHALLLVLGPGALLGLGVVIGAFLLVRGNEILFPLVIGALVLALGSRLSKTGHVTEKEKSSFGEAGDVSPTVITLVLLGGAFLANGRQFPNLFVPGGVMLAAVVAMQGSRRALVKGAYVVIAAVIFVRDVVSRADYWWVASDDTTTLSGIGTMIIERGRVADTAGWPTSSHHWLLHAWLAFWNNVSFSQIFETYLIAWPLVAAGSLAASLWLGLERFLGRPLSVSQIAVVLTVMAGVVRFEWTAPQEQQPFVFAVVSCCALILSHRKSSASRAPWQKPLGLAILLSMVAVGFYVLKPSLLVAYGLLVAGTVFVWLKLTVGFRLFIGTLLSLGTIAAGIALMSLGESFVSDRSFTKITIQFFPRDLGWCQADSSRLGSLMCIFSLQVLLFAAGLLASIAVWILRRRVVLDVSPLLLMPLVLAYVPLRYFVNSDVGSGAPSFYRLSEMAVMLVIALGVAVALKGKSLSPLGFVMIVLVALAANRIGQGPGDVYNFVDSILTSFRFSRFLNAADAMALFIAVLAGVMLALHPRYRIWPTRQLLVLLLLVSMLPTARIGLKNWNAEPESEELSRPAYLGPPDIEEIGAWMRKNTDFGTLFATNFLCPSYRLEECTRETPEVACARRHPVLFASWALTALSRREFLYLSQDWSKGNKYFSHRLSTQLGSEVSLGSVAALSNQGVDFYVVSREHSDQQAWELLRDAATYRTENFAVVSLTRLKKNLA